MFNGAQLKVPPEPVFFFWIYRRLAVSLTSQETAWCRIDPNHHHGSHRRDIWPHFSFRPYFPYAMLSL